MFGAFLLKYRLQNGMTQTELAKKLSISQNAVSQYESGKRVPTVKRIANIAMALDCSITDIMSAFESDRLARGIPPTDKKTETERPGA